MTKIKRLGHLVLRVSNLEKSIEFYCDRLGFVVAERGDEVHHHTAFLSVGGSGHTVDLVQVDRAKLADNSMSSLHHFALQVDSFEDLRDTYFALMDGGVEVLKPTDHVAQKSFHVKDPDGNIVEICYELPDALEILQSGRDDRDEVLVFERPS